MHPVLFTLGGVTIYSYGMAVAVGAVICFWLAHRWAPRFGVDPEHSTDGVFLMFLMGIVGARLFYVAEYLGDYAREPWRIFWLREGGLVWYGGFIGAALVGVLYARFRKWPFFKIADLYMPILAIGHAIGRIGCFLNGCCYGIECPVGVTFPNVEGVRLPTQLIEAAGLLMISAFLYHALSRRKKEGEIFAAYLLLYGALRFTVEFLRGEQAPVGLFTIGQWVSLGMLAAGFAVRAYLKRKVS